MAFRTRRGFTLVELLVVIGIIAVLISLLMPALNKIRMQSQRTQCMSNLRSINQLMMLYAHRNRDFVPLGYLGSGGGDLQFNYIIGQNSATPSYRGPFGELYAAQLIIAPRVFYCPSQTNEPQLVYDGPSNRWFVPTAAPVSNIRVGYGSRPLGRWSGSSFIQPTTANAAYTRPFPKKTKLGSKTAIVADIVSAPVFLKTGHWPWANVAYNDGSVQPFDVRQFPATWQALSATFGPANNDLMLTGPLVTPASGIWVDMDMK